MPFVDKIVIESTSNFARRLPVTVRSALDFVAVARLAALGWPIDSIVVVVVAFEVDLVAFVFENFDWAEMTREISKAF